MGWVLMWRHTSASTTSIKFIIYSSKQGNGIAKSAEQQFLGQHDLVVKGTEGTYHYYFLHSLFLSEGHGVNILVLMQSSCVEFCSHSLLQVGAVPIPACRLFDMARLMSSSHILLILHSPHLPAFYFLNAPDEVQPLIQGAIFALCGI
jgi:hypothetical protein